MNREIKFRAWDTLQGGKFEYWDAKTNAYDGIFWTMIQNKSFKKPQQFTGLKYKSGRECYENDIAFDEIEHSLKDERLYYVCAWIKEWGRFAWLNIIEEYFGYIENGADYLDGVMQDTYSIEDTPKYHYAGNIYETPDLLSEKL